MSWPSSLSHTASLGYLPSGDSHRLQERVGSCSEPPESAQALTCPHPSCSATSRDLFSLLGQSPSAKLFTSLPFSLPPAYLCLSLQERKAFLSHSLLQLPRRPTFLKKWTWLCRPRCNLVLSGTIPWEQLPKVIADLLVAKSRGWVESLSDLDPTLTHAVRTSLPLEILRARVLGTLCTPSLDISAAFPGWQAHDLQPPRFSVVSPGMGKPSLQFPCSLSFKLASGPPPPASWWLPGECDHSSQAPASWQSSSQVEILA